MTISLPLTAMILCSIFCYFVAKLKGAHPIRWAIYGFLFTIFSIPFVFFSKPDEDDSE